MHYIFESRPTAKPPYTTIDSNAEPLIRMSASTRRMARPSLLARVQRNLQISPEPDRLQGPSVCERDIDLATNHTKSLPVSRPKARVRELALALYHWTTCLFITALVLAQLLGAIWDTRTTFEHVQYGRSPLLGSYEMVGTNDIPFADRAIACVRRGTYYEPRLVSSLLASEGIDAILEDSTGAARHGYRLIQRQANAISYELDSSINTSYRVSCDLIATTLDAILGACSLLGYANLTTDALRVVDGVNSKHLYRLPDALPVLILPYWDNTEQARHAIPTWDGDACIFRLEDAFFGAASGVTDTNEAMASFRGVNQTVRQQRTIEWLGRPGGVWRNGWYEEGGERWYSDVTSSMPGAPYYMTRRLFDMRSGLERDCAVQDDCLGAAKVDRWGPKFFTQVYTRNVNSVTIVNGDKFGLFLYDADQVRTVRSAYDWETLLSNTSVGLVLIRWIMALVSLSVGATRYRSQFVGGGIGCVARAKTFTWLPMSMLPRLKMTLAAFWTVGCYFEGHQSGLSEAWFAIYPAIAQLVFMYFSLLNLLAHITRRRMSDVLFAPTVVFLCLMHYFRLELARSDWLAGVDGRIPTVVFSDEVKKLQLTDYFTSNIAWRMNGQVTSLFVAKLILLGINVLPLMIARPFPIVKRGVARKLHGVEKALALRVEHVGGLGRSPMYSKPMDSKLRPSAVSVAVNPMSSMNRKTSKRYGDGPIIDDTINGDENAVTPFYLETPAVEARPPTPCALLPPSHKVYLNSYELVRLGYLVFGEKYLITFDEWDLLSSMAPLRSYCNLWNHRVLVWTLQDASTDVDDTGTVGGRALLSLEPEMWRLDDPRLVRIWWWQVSSCAIQC